MKMKKMNGITLYELPNYTYQKYIKYFKHKKNISPDIVQKELSRNVLLGKRLIKDNTYNQEIYLFDKMKIRINITIDGRHVITGLWFNCEPDPFWMLHEKNYKKISKKLGLEVDECAKVS